MVKAIIFDCFGVLVTDAMQVITSELAERDPQAAREVIGIIHANNRGLLRPAQSRQRIANILGITSEALVERIQKGEIKDRELMDYIRKLRRHYKTALLSNVGTQGIETRFSEQELVNHFDAVIISGELGIMKPDPEIYLHAAEKLAVRPRECIFVDDRETHCQGALRAGMQAIHYQNLAQMKRELETILKS